MSMTINFPTDDGEVLIRQDKVNAAEIKDGTIKVWLNTSNPYVFNYKDREMAKKDFAKLKKYLNEEEEKIIKEKLINKACEWLSQTDFKPADKEYTFKAIPRLLEMIEPTNRAKAYCQKLIDSLIKEGYVMDAKIVRDCLKQMNGEKVAMATMDEQKPAEWSKEDTGIIDGKI